MAAACATVSKTTVIIIFSDSTIRPKPTRKIIATAPTAFNKKRVSKQEATHFLRKISVFRLCTYSSSSAFCLFNRTRLLPVFFIDSSSSLHREHQTFSPQSLLCINGPLSKLMRRYGGEFPCKGKLQTKGCIIYSTSSHLSLQYIRKIQTIC